MQEPTELFSFKPKALSSEKNRKTDMCLSFLNFQQRKINAVKTEIYIISLILFNN